MHCAVQSTLVDLGAKGMSRYIFQFGWMEISEIKSKYVQIWLFVTMASPVAFMKDFFIIFSTGGKWKDLV